MRNPDILKNHRKLANRLPLANIAIRRAIMATEGIHEFEFIDVLDFESIDVVDNLHVHFNRFIIFIDDSTFLDVCELSSLFDATELAERGALRLSSEHTHDTSWGTPEYGSEIEILDYQDESLSDCFLGGLQTLIKVGYPH